MRHFLLFTSLFFCLQPVFSQHIIVKDKETNQPLFNVAIYNFEKTKSTLTDFDGKADISNFSENEKLIFSHVAFIRAIHLKSEIQKAHNEVLLLPNSNQLNEIVLSVSKFGQDKKNIPQKVVSISGKDIQLFNPQTSADLLESTGQVYVQKSQLGGGSPMIRGFATNRLLITVDGVRMNNAIFRGGNLQNIISIDPLALERTEVILGPGPVVYGSDAVGGVMNFYTLQPKFSFSEKTAFSGSAFTRYATANNEKTGHFDINIGGQKWAAASSITFSDFDDLKMGRNGPDSYLRPFLVVQQNGEDVAVPNSDPEIQKPTGYHQLNLLQKIRYMPNNNWDFNLGLHYSTTSDYDRYDRLVQLRDGQPRFAQWYYGPQVWMLGDLEVQHNSKHLFYDKSKLNLAYQLFKESRHNRAFQDEIFYENFEKVDAYSTNFDFEKKLGEHQLFYGLEYVYNIVNSNGLKLHTESNLLEVSPSRYPDNSQWQSAAIYLSNQWQINQELHLTSGIRYSNVSLHADFSETAYDFPFSEANMNTGALTGNFGLAWKATDFLNWKFNLASAFRAPNIDDIGKVFDSEPGAVVVPNPDLHAEHSYNGEIGFQINVDQKFSLDFATYYTILDNALVRRPYQLNGESTIIYQGQQSQVQAIQNAANAYAYGFEAGAEFFIFKNLRLNSQIALTNGMEEQEDGTEAPLRHAAPFFGNSHLIWKNEKFKIDFFAEYNGGFDFDELAPSEQAKAYLYALDENGNPYFPSWHTINIAGQYKFSENLQINAVVENISDQRYRTYSSGIAAAGRNLVVAIKYIF